MKVGNLELTWARTRETLARVFTPRRLLIGGALAAGFLVSALLMDQLVMPWYTRHGVAQEVPSVVGERFEVAKEILNSHGLEIVKQGETHNPNLPFGYVADQHPRANRQVKPGRRVYVTVSVGEREVEVPNLLGLSETNAVERLKSVRLRAGEREYEYIENEPANIVIDQTISPNTLVKAGTAIDFTVSLGAPVGNAKVPSILGKTLDVARREIRKSGLTVGEIEYKVSSEFLPNTVIWQSIPPGSEVARGDTLDLVVTAMGESNEEAYK